MNKSEQNIITAFAKKFTNARRNNMNVTSEPTWRCHQNPFVGALGIQELVILGEGQFRD